MNNFKTKFFRGYAASVLILMSVFVQAETEGTISAQLTSLQTFDGQPLVLEQDKLTHLIFQEIWSSYEGQGEEARVAALPEDFKSISQQLWVQPEINVTEAQLQEYQGYYPQITPLVLDRGFDLMRSLDGWNLPLHVIIKGRDKVFSGSGDQLRQWLEGGMQSQAATAKEALPLTTVSFSAAKNIRYHKPVAGDNAPVFTAKTMEGKTVSLLGLSYHKPLSLVFIDSLCPMPHFPGCEAKLEQLNKQVANDSSRQWLGVVSSYYVNKDIAQQFRDKFHLKLPLVFDVDNQIYQSYGVHVSPYQIDIARGGVIRSRGDEIH